MSGAKPWQIGLIVIGLLAGVVGLVFALGSGGRVEMADSVTVVDVTNGDLYRINTNNRSIIMPMKHGETGERVLLFVNKDDETGRWIIPPRYRTALQHLEYGNVIDPESGVIDIPESSEAKSVSW